MTVQADEKEVKMIEELTREAEILIGEAGSKWDLKERRGIIKQTLYSGSKKLKAIVPKGVRI